MKLSEKHHTALIALQDPDHRIKDEPVPVLTVMHYVVAERSEHEEGQYDL